MYPHVNSEIARKQRFREIIIERGGFNKMAKKKKEKTKKEKIKGRVLYSLGNVSQITSYILLGNLTYALTESFSMTAKMVGLILLVSRIFDGFTDVVAGFIIDKTKTRWGKARPYEILYIPLWITVILCFSVPYSLGEVGKIMWVFIFYNVSQSICNTFVTCIESVRLRRSFKESVRVRVVTVSTIFVFAAGALISLLVPVFISIFEDVPYGWTIISSIFAIPFMICGILRFFLLKEIGEDEAPDPDSEKVSIKQSVKALFQNPYAFIVAGVTLLAGINGSNPATNYYYKYFFGDVAIATIPGLFGMLSIIMIIFLPNITNKLGTQKTMMAGFALLAIGCLARYLMPRNLIWLVVFGSIGMIGTMYVTSLQPIALIESMTYGEWKSKAKFEGIYASVSGMANKLGMGLGSILAGFILDWGGYDGNLAVQSDSAMSAIQFVFTGLPGILGILGVLLMLTYNLNKKLPQIENEIAERNKEPASSTTA